jgi:hypothetical protein
MPRRQFFIFRVNVPKDWGEKELVWTLASNSRVEKAYGKLLPTWEIDRLIEVSKSGGAGGSDNATIDRNQPPNVTVAPVQQVTVGQPLTLTATVTDDGIPKPELRRKQAIGQKTPPTLKPRGEPSPVNVPLPVASRPPSGLSILWSVYRGPALVGFDPAGYIAAKDGTVVVSATFSEPGTYRLRAIGTDGMLKTPTDVTVTVTGSSTR